MTKMRKFWNFTEDENNVRVLKIKGAIAEESWLNDETTPKQFESELIAGDGDITVIIDSPGGDVFAASQIYNMLMDYKGKVTVKIDSLAASAASVIAMSGEEVLVSPLSQIMLHNPITAAVGDTDEMNKAISMLDEIKESLINAYQIKTNLSRAKISKMMDAETWLNAKKAVELGFADKILYTENQTEEDTPEAMSFSRMAVTNTILNKLNFKHTNKTKIESLYKRLNLLKRG